MRGTLWFENASHSVYHLISGIIDAYGSAITLELLSFNVQTVSVLNAWANSRRNSSSASLINFAVSWINSDNELIVSINHNILIILVQTPDYLRTMYIVDAFEWAIGYFAMGKEVNYQWYQ
eukprot:1010893_1